MDIVIGITGATGAVYGVRLLEKLKSIEEVNTHLIISEWGRANIEIETNYTIDYVENLATNVYNNKDMAAAVSSGSFLNEGMIILPCSMKTLSAISNGYADSLISRVADVMLKEGRKLIISPRETPLSTIHLENMTKLSRLGVRIIPPMPAFYNNPNSIDDIVNHTVMKILDQFGVHINKEKRWNG